MTSYDAIPAVRRSDLWEMRKSPAHYLYRVTHQEEQTPALLFGIAAHKYILEPGSFWDEYIEVPKLDRRTKEGRALWQEIIESGKTPISGDDMDIIRNMDQAIMQHPGAFELLGSGLHEVPIEWTDAVTGEKCKCRPDVITSIDGEDWIVDYKTTASCDGSAFERSCRKYGYNLQAAMYTEGVLHSMFIEARFAFVAQEKTPPYAVRIYRCDPDFVEDGMALFRELIEKLHDCKESGEWPGYEDEVLYGE